MKAKYIEEEYPPWFDFGGICIAYNTEKEHCVSGLSSEDQEKLIKEHNRVVEKLCQVALAWANSDHEAFTKYWYESLKSNGKSN